MNIALPDVIEARYAGAEAIGGGGQGNTFRATDRRTGDNVVIKELRLRAAESVKALELFEREARVLESLDHPRIPRYLDYLHVGPDDDPRFFLIQQFVDGPTLLEVIERGERWDEQRARRLLAELLEILVYIHERQPPVLHRDVKPANVIVRPDGAPVLVDFGAAQTVLRQTMSNSTVVGTTGYMAPEQFTGRAVPASDLFGLGATMIHLLSHVHPAELPIDGLKLEFESRVAVSDDLAAILGRMTEPAVERRFPTAREVLAMLDTRGAIFDYQPPADHQMLTRVAPRGSEVKLRRTTGRLELRVPTRRRRRVVLELLALVLGAAVFATAAFEVSEVISSTLWFTVVFVVAGFIRLKRELFRFQELEIAVGDQGLRLRRTLLGTREEHFPHPLGIELGAPGVIFVGATERVRPIQIVDADTERELAAFGESLTAAERDWIVDELDDVLREYWTSGVTFGVRTYAEQKRRERELKGQRR